MDDWQVLDLYDGDPTPGEPASIQAMATTLQHRAGEANRHATRLRSIVANRGALALRGEFAATHDRELTWLPSEATTLADCYLACAKALSAFADDLIRLQVYSRGALRLGEAADSRYQALLAQFCGLTGRRTYGPGIWRGLDESFAAGQREPLFSQVIAIGRNARLCEAERGRARASALRAKELYQVAADRCAQAIRAAASRLSEAANESSDVPGFGSEGPRVHGGHTTRPRNMADYDRQERWAEEAYNAIRQYDDTETIAGHIADAPRLDGSAGFSRQEIEEIRRHIFFDEHPMDDYAGGIIRQRYDPSAPMAEAWLRLRRGDPLPEDYALLEHELAELRYYRTHPQADYREAHLFANSVSNWERSIPGPTYEDFANFGG
ncbi:hypothetical protein ACGFIE_31640 [Micromonospora sp. NPDC049275]|uniref:hypothetical protein n=1 Tax=Micromonospora sp. NPDC049275 TaxID=3364268 RepID=UPI00370F852C